MTSSSRLNGTSLTFTNAESETGTVSFNAEAEFQFNKTVVATQGVVSTGLVVHSGASAVAQSNFDTLTIGTIQGVNTCGFNGSTSGVLTLRAAATTTSHTVTMPSAQGAANTILQNDGTGSLSWVASVPRTALYWVAESGGDPRANQRINATFNGEAVWHSDLNGVNLVTNNNSGCVNWNVSGFDFSREFRIQAAVLQRNADGIFVCWGGSGAFSTSAANVGGAAFQYNTYGYTTQWFKGTAQVGTNKAIKGNVLDLWTTIVIEHRKDGAKRFVTAYHGVNGTLQSSQDATSWTYGGSFLAVGARSGLDNHFCNSVILEYL